VILLDANLLVYAVVRETPPHEAARHWLEGRLNQSARVGLPWPSLLAFLRLTTNGRIMAEPLSIDRAWRQVEEWLALDVTWIPEPTAAHATVLGPLLRHATRPDLVPDAHLAALAIEHGLVLCSADADFARFPGLRWENPIRARA
jgi:toxin-antitoxin system PIN domain toxin